MAARLPGADEDDRVVLHVDMDCFYAACERRREPSLEGEPVVVGMGYEPGETHGAVATASYEAREHGVESAQPISEALELLPRAEGNVDGDGPIGHYRPVDMTFYETVASEVKALLQEVPGTVREVSIDEAYLDVTDGVSWEGAPVFAESLKKAITERAGVPASVGVAPNMSAAKLASDHDKPDGLVVVRPGEVAAFLAPLPVEDLHGVGPVTARELRGMGIHTAGDLASADRDALSDAFGERGRTIHDHARGVDPRPVEPRGDPKSLNSESAFTEATDDFDRLTDRVDRLAEEICDRAEDEGALYKTIGVKVVTPPFDVNTRAWSLSGPVQDRDLVREVARDLLEEFRGETVRKLGVRVANLSFGGDQSSLDSWEEDGAVPSDGDAAGGIPGGQTRFDQFTADRSDKG